MKGKLKDGRFFVGAGEGYGVPERGKVVTIVAKENHPVFGERFKIKGHDEWFEKNCFDYVTE